MTKRAQKMLRLMDRAVTEWHIPVIGKEKGRVIKRLLARHKPTRGIEVGSLFGYSAILIAANMPRGGHLTCVEQNPYLARFAQSNADHAGLKSRVKVVVGDALRVLPFLRGPVDFVLIDMEHTGFDAERIADLVAWFKATDIAPFVRVPQGLYHFMARTMDAGALGV